MNEELRQWRGLVDGSKVETRALQGRDHLVMPVVMMQGDSVVRALGSSGPEFVPAALLAKLPQRWNYRVAVTDHPDNGAGSANKPETIEAMGVGHIFDVDFRNGSLQGSLWIDVERATEMGGDAESIVERALAGEMLEVSIGAMVMVMAERGEIDGDSYEFVWVELHPDHLAVLPASKKGACSNKDGCGTPRSAVEVASLVMRAAEEDGDMDEKQRRGLFAWISSLREDCDESVESLRDEVVALIRAGLYRAEDEEPRALLGLSDTDIRDAVWMALRADVPALDGIQSIYPDDGVVIFATFLDNEFALWQQGYSLEGSGAATSAKLAGKAKQVEPVTEFKPVTASDDIALTPGDDPGCKCNSQPGEERQAADTHNQGGQTMSATAELVAKLVALGSTPWTNDDSDVLGTFGEARLLELIEDAENAEVDEPKPEPDPEPSEPTSDTGDEEEDVVQLSRATHDRLLAAATAHERTEASHKARVLESLKGVQGYSQKDLEAMEIGELKKLTRALGRNEIPSDAPMSYEGQEGSRANGASRRRAMPDSYGLNKGATN